MYGTCCKAHFIPEKLKVRMGNNGRQHPPPKLKILLVLEQSRSWGSVDQELHQCSYLVETLCTTYYSNPYVLWISWLICWFLVDGAYCHFIPRLGRLRDWTTFTGIFLASYSGSYLGVFASFFKSGLRFPDGTLKSLKVYDPHHGRKFWPSSSYSKVDMWSFG